MIATFVFELASAIYVLIKHFNVRYIRFIVGILTLLAVFQVAEYNVCEQGLLSPEIWSRVGYIAIAMLPAVGLHFIHAVSGRSWHGIVMLGYLAATVFSLTFGMSDVAFSGYECSGNYVIFQLKPPLGGLFFIYYFSLLIVGVVFCWYFARQASRLVGDVLLFQALGYILFMFPTGVVNAINPETIDGLPSVMCGFAVLYAAVLVIGVVPKLIKLSQSGE